jgi:hypothetical protein
MFAGMASDAVSQTRMKVFISCAREDVGFADQLAAFLTDNGFKPIVDQLEMGSPEALIADAEAYVFVLTTASARSAACARELDEAKRLGKPIVAVAPAPLNGLRPPAGLSDVHCIYFYSEPAVPGSGFFDGQKRLKAVLRPHARPETVEHDLEAERRALAREREDSRRAQERQRKEEQKRERQERKLARRLAEAQMQNYFPQRPRVRFPTFRAAILGVFAAAVLAVLFVPGMPGRIRAMLGDASAVVSTLAEEEEPYSPMSVSVEEFAPERDLIAGRGGANVRNYPLTSGTLLAHIAEGTRLGVTGRLQVQGHWWFRVVMPDERVGFVREDVVRWDRQQSTPSRVAEVQAIEPAVAIEAGRAGANLRTRPTRNGRALVRLPAGADMSATGKVRQGGHWWVRVALEDGREGFVRDDVITAESRAALNL